MIEAWFLVLSLGRGAVMVPDPFPTKEACRTAMEQSIQVSSLLTADRYPTWPVERPARYFNDMFCLKGPSR